MSFMSATEKPNLMPDSVNYTPNVNIQSPDAQMLKSYPLEQNYTSTGNNRDLAVFRQTP